MTTTFKFQASGKTDKQWHTFLIEFQPGEILLYDAIGMARAKGKQFVQSTREEAYAFACIGQKNDIRRLQTMLATKNWEEFQTLFLEIQERCQEKGQYKITFNEQGEIEQ